ESQPDEVTEFLATFLGRSWGMESGLSHPSDFRRENYNSVAQYIEPGFIFAKLTAKYGSDIGLTDFHQADEIPIDRRVAHQFSFVHRKATEQAAATPQA